MLLRRAIHPQTVRAHLALVLAGPHAGDGGQIVRVHRRNGLFGIATRRYPLEPRDAVREHAAALELRAYAGTHGAEVLADDVAARANALQREDVEHLARRIADVGALPWITRFRDPPQAKHSHHMVDAHAAAAAHRCTQRFHQRLVRSCAQKVWIEWWNPPRLSGSVELVWWRADARTRCDDVLPQPCISTVRCEPDGHVVHDGQLARRAAQLAIEHPLQPAVKVDTVAVLAGKTLHRRRVGRSICRGPCPPPS